jgi:prepilin-type processing-associated H-X9-DG protein
MFDLNWAVSARKVCDGLSNTMAMGEATYGPNWPLSNALARNPANAISYPAPSFQLVDLRTNPLGRDGYGQQRIAWQAWFLPDPWALDEFLETRITYCSTFACTLEPMNKTPVTASLLDEQHVDDCNKSGPSAPGTKGVTTRDGFHITVNFRSDHAGGCNFLLADGSVHFLNETIDMLLYQQLSTMMGGEVVAIPD